VTLTLQLVLNSLAASCWVLLQIFIVILLVRAAASFFPARRPGVWAWAERTSEALTDPLLAPVQARVPPWSGLDMSPLIVLVGAYVATLVVTGVLGVVAHYV